MNKRPDFIPKDEFRKYMPTSSMYYFYVDGIEVKSYVSRWKRLDNPIRSADFNGSAWYRPIDIVARAYAHGHRISSPAYELKKYLENSIHEMNKLKIEVEDKTAKLIVEKHVLDNSILSKSLTKKLLLNESEIVSKSIDLLTFSGVYFLIKNEKVVYVGQSVNVFNRISSHRYGKDFDKYAYILVDVKSLDIVESLYIHTLRPPLNGFCNGKGDILSAPISLDKLFEMVPA